MTLVVLGIFVTYSDSMEPHRNQSERPTISPLFVAALLSAMTFAIWIVAPIEFLIGFLCILVSAAIGLLLKTSGLVRTYPQQPKLLQVLLDLSCDREISGIHASVSESLKRIANQRDPVFRKLAASRLRAIATDCNDLGNATVEFVSTESWRVVYEELLRSPGLHLYRSVAHIESAQYWQDGPGQQSTQLNLELHDAGVVSIERTAIIADHLWPNGDLFPIDPLHSWLDLQHRHGIWLRLVRESALENDTDLLSDFGIYGSRAVGFQTADPAGRTIRFFLNFDFDKVQEAEVKWNRLAVYAISYRDILDQQH